jgi:hypothetical protein
MKLVKSIKINRRRAAALPGYLADHDDSRAVLMTQWESLLLTVPSLLPTPNTAETGSQFVTDSEGEEDEEDEGGEEEHKGPG